MDGELERLMESNGLNVSCAQSLSPYVLPKYILAKLTPLVGANDIILLDGRTRLTTSDDDDATFDYVMISRGIFKDEEFYDCISFSIFGEQEPEPKLALSLTSKMEATKGLLQLSMGREWAKVEYDHGRILYVPSYPLNLN